jgi:hypothetical protein
MGIFKALGEGAYAANDAKELARRLGVPASLIPKHQKDAILKLSRMYKEMGYSVDQADDVLLISVGDTITKDISSDM